MEKLILALVTAARKLRPYFQAHTIEVPTEYPMKQVLHKLETSGRLMKWVDSCHSRVIQNQQNLYPKLLPTVVVKVLQYSGIGSNTGMSFLRTNDLSEVKNGEFGLDFKVVIKIGGLVVCKLKFK